MRSLKCARALGVALYLAVVGITVLFSSAQANPPSGTAIGPGVGGQVHAFAFDPADSNAAYAGGDVCGVYKFDKSEGKWSPWSLGLGDGGLNMSYYVDDLLVVRELPGQYLIPDSAEGVYAATWGGVYFRHDDGTPWMCLTANSNYTGGYARKFFNDSSRNTPIRIPFSSLALDRANATIYAGAGHARFPDKADQTDIYKEMYPCVPATDPWAPLHQSSLWACDLSTQTFSEITHTPNGNVRQVAVAQLNGISSAIYACDEGVFAYSLGNPEPTNLWPSAAKIDFDELGQSDDPWGVGVGSGGLIYALMSREDPTRRPGLWRIDLGDSNPAWSEVGASPTDILWPHNIPWSDFVDQAGNDLTELTVYPGATAADDEIFVGQGRDHSTYQYGVCGYFRFGKYLSSISQEITGWIHFHRTTNEAPGVIPHIEISQWTAGPIHDVSFIDEQAGWHRYFPSLRALVPFARHPMYRHLMVGIDYGIPMMTQDGGATWSNLYCKPDLEGGWESRGLNLMCARSSALLADGRLVMAAWDYGVFIGSSPENTGFVPLHDPNHATPPNWPRGDDVAVIQALGGAEVYLVDSEDHWDSGDTGTTIKRDKIWKWTEPATDPMWTLVSGAIANAVSAIGGFDISDIVTVGQDTMYAAVGTQVSGWERHYYICEGTRTPTGWGWRKAYDVDTSDPGHATKIVQKLCTIPGTHRLLYSAKFQNGIGGPSSGGLYCVDDYRATTWQVVPWLEGEAVLSTGDARGRLARNVTAIAVDSLGSVVYAGCSGHDSPWSQGRGGVVRFNLNGSAPADTTILAGGNDWTSDAFDIGDVTNFPGSADPAGWEYFTHVYDLEVDPRQPMVVYAAVGNGSYFDSSFGAWSYRGNTWVRECNVPEAGSSGATVSLARTRNRLYLGTFAQEFFVANVDVPLVPTIATSADGPIWSTGHATPTTFSVSISHPENLNMGTVELYPDALGVTGPIAMCDSGPAVSPGTDLVAGDHIYTSASFSSNVSAGTYQVRVFAQATDGGYDQEMVVVDAVPYAAKFNNVSSGPEAGLLGLNYSGTPYSAVSFDYNEDVKKDLLITQSDDAAVIYGETAISPSGAPSFESRATFGTSGWRGAASADYDNNGDVDIFLAGTSGAVLLRNDNSGFSGTDVTADEGLSGIDNALAACWGDYNRDGWLDLYVVRGSTTTGSPGEVDHGLQHRLFENCKGEGGHFVDVTDAAGMKDLAAIPSTSAGWTDVDLDGDLDLFVAMAPFVPDSFKSPSQPLPIASRLFLNQDDGTFVQGFDSRFAEQMTGISAAVWADVNNDFWPDLLLGMRGYGARAYLNDGTGHFDTPAVKLQDEAMGYDGLAITDQDLDGWQDVLLAPSGPGRPVSLLLNKEWSGHRGFAEASVAAGLDGVVPVSGLLATDFTRDGDTELFAGMQTTVHNFFYKTDAQDGTSRLSGAYVKVRLESTSRGNPQDGTGARVVIAAVPGGGAIGLPQMQVVDGGSGRGSQRDRDLLFGLGNYEGSVVATVFWPGGGTQTAVPLIVSDSSAGETVNVITDTTAPTVSNVSVESFYDPSSNTLTWTFFWDTDMNSNWKDDEIQFVNYVQGYCSPGGDGVMATDPGVSHSYVAKPGGGYRHSIVISDVECFAPCRFTYRVGSGKGIGKSYSPYYQKRILVCPSQF